MQTKCLVFAIILTVGSSTLNAIVNMTILEVGTDIVFTSEGSLNTTGFGASVNVFSSRFMLEIDPSQSTFSMIGKPDEFRSYTDTSLTISEPDNFGTGGFAEYILRPGGSLTGSGFGIFWNRINVPKNYVSGSYLTMEGSYANETFESLGLTPGLYTWELAGEGNTMNLQIGPTIPEPSATWIYLGVAGACALFTRRRR